MEKASEIAETHALARGRHPMYSTICQENSRGWKRDGLVVISDYSLDLYSPDGLTFKKEYVWLGLMKISREKERIKLKFEQGKIQLESFTNAAQIYQTIVYNLLNLFTVNQLNQVGLNEFISEKPNPSKRACLLRLKQYSELRLLPYPKKIENLLNRFFVTNETIIRIPDKDYKMLYLKYIMKSISFCLPFKGLIFPPNRNEILADYLTENIDKIRLLEFISLEGKARHFCKFFDTFSHVDVTKICGIELSNSCLQPKHMASLSNFCDVKSIVSLSLHNAFSPETKLSFYTNFFTANMMMNLAYLNLDNTPQLDLINLIPNIPRLVYFSVANCDLLIEDIIHITQLPLLRTLDVSFNKCDRFPPNAIQFPKSLTKLKASGVTWAEGTLVNMFKVISLRKELGLHIDLSNAKVQQDEFEKLSTEFDQSLNFPLISLNWNSNPVGFSFFEYLRKSMCLKSLHLDGIFTETSPELDLLCHFIKITTSLHYLSIQGSEERFLASSVSKVVAALAKTSIKEIDLSNNKIPDESLVKIGDLFSPKSTLQVVACDNNHPATYDSIVTLLETAGGSLKTNFLFPIEDFMELKAKNKIPKEIYDQTLTNFKKPEEISTFLSQNINIPEKSPYIKPFLLTTKRKKEKTLYISREKSDSMKDIPKDKFLTSRICQSSSFALMDSASVIIQLPEDKKTISQQMSDFVSEYHMSNSRLDRFSTDDEIRKVSTDDEMKKISDDEIKKISMDDEYSPRKKSVRNFDSVLISPSKKKTNEFSLDQIQSSPKKKKKQEPDNQEQEQKKRERKKPKVEKQIDEIPKKTKKQKKLEEEYDDEADINEPEVIQQPRKKKNRRIKPETEEKLQINTEIYKIRNKTAPSSPTKQRPQQLVIENTNNMQYFEVKEENPRNEYKLRSPTSQRIKKQRRSSYNEPNNHKSNEIPQENYPKQNLFPEPFVSGVGRVQTPPYSYSETESTYSYYSRPYSYSVSYSPQPHHHRSVISHHHHENHSRRDERYYHNDDFPHHNEKIPTKSDNHHQNEFLRRIHGESPHHEHSPRHQEFSPHRQYQSPRMNEISPRYQDYSPHRHEISPHHHHHDVVHEHRSQSLSKRSPRQPDLPKVPKMRAANEEDLMPINPYMRISDEIYEKANISHQNDKSRFDEIIQPPKPLEEMTARQKLEALMEKKEERPLESHASFGSRIRRLMNQY